MTGELSERTRNILTRYRSIAMIGVSGNPTRASYRALVHMKSKGYIVYPVNPSYDEIRGLKCYKSLLEIGQPVDIVDIFRRGDTVLPLVSEAREIGAKVFWMQIGVHNDEAAAQALGTSLRGVSLRVTLSPRALFSTDAASLEQLDQAARTHQRALVYLTSNSIGQMAAKPSDALRVLSLLDARAGGVIAVADSSAAAAPPEWPLARASPWAPWGRPRSTPMGGLQAVAQRAPARARRFALDAGDR